MGRRELDKHLAAALAGDAAASAWLAALTKDPVTAAALFSVLLPLSAKQRHGAALVRLEARCRKVLGFPDGLTLKRDTNLDTLAARLVRLDSLDAAEAVRRYDALLHPDDPERELKLACVIEYEHGDTARAAALLRESVKRFPKHADLHQLLGLVLARLGQLDEALRLFRRTVDLDPKEECAARSSLAWALGATGDIDAMSEQATRALELAGDAVSLEAGWTRAQSTFCLYLLGPAEERDARFQELIVNLLRGDRVFDWSFAALIQRAKQAKHPHAAKLRLLARVVNSDAELGALDTWPVAREAIAAAKRQRRKSKQKAPTQIDPGPRGLSAVEGTRYFEKREGSRVTNWQIEQEGVRYSVGWGVDDGQTTGQSMTCQTVEEASAAVARKLRAKLREGFVEIFPAHTKKRQRARKLKPVLDAYASHAKKFDFVVLPLPGLQRSYQVFGGLGFSEYLMIGPNDETGLWFAVKEGTTDERQVQRFMTFLEARHAEVFAVEVVWKVRLPKPIGVFDHALIASPEVANVYHEGLTQRQLFMAFPIHDCEFRGDENVGASEARIHGRGSIPTSTWNRKPHPVLDMCVQSAAAKKPAKRLIFDPSRGEPANTLQHLASLPAGSSVEVTNYLGEQARVVHDRGLTLELPGMAAKRLAAKQIVRHLQTFIGEP
jgi:tetratricopeptide (TPR) repeat protein